jgi:hypothetical protein
MPRGPKPGVQRKHGADMTVDDTILKALEGGPVTVNDILKHFEKRVRIRLAKLRVRGVVIREGRGGAHREFTYRLARPDLAAKAIGEKGGLSRAHSSAKSR